MSDIKVNGLVNPVGIAKDGISFSYKPKSVGQHTAVLKCGDDKILSKELIRSDFLHFTLDTEYEEGKCYTLEILCDGKSECERCFEIARELDADFITVSENIGAPVICKKFTCNSTEGARLYITALGLYRAFINGKRVGEDYLAPGYNDYDAYLRYNTYDISNLLVSGENEIEVHIGNGWYKGRIGIDKPVDKGDKVFGDKYLLCAKIVTDGGKNTVKTDETWTAHRSLCTENSIYDGETRDFTLNCEKEYNSVKANVAYNLVPAFSEPIKEKAQLKPKLIITPKGESVLDFGQNMVGFVRFTLREPQNKKVTLYHGEVLQDGCFYNDNLRTAKAKAEYISDGKERVCEPFFTYFGFRYVKVEGIENINPDDFCGVVIYSDLEGASECKTDNEKINRLIENALWGQRGNFLDVPTDCPQRDERLGWTADTQVFVNTACYNMDCLAFYRKYMADLRADQTMYYGGDIPMYSPSLKHEAGEGGAVWADAATIIPWNVYNFYGDKKLLENNYRMMRDYTETLISKDEKDGARGLILNGFTFGDWVAQDGVCPQALNGGTDTGYIMSVYYYNSVKLTAKAAGVLGYIDDEKRYFEKSEKIYNAILDEFFSLNGKLAIDTQTGYVLSLYYGIYRDKNRVVNDFKDRLAKDFYKIKSGFTGTPLMLPTLFENGMDNEAYRILYNEEFPGWLYCVNLGATTIWERWNSLLSDGKISGTNMNSLNHYAYGSVVEAIYSYIAGLKPSGVGFTSVKIEPHPNYRMKNIRFEYNSPSGKYSVEWRINKDNTFLLECKIPPYCEAEVIMPDKKAYTVKEGTHTFVSDTDFNHPFSLDTPISDLVKNEKTASLMRKMLPQAYAMVTGENEEFLTKTPRFFFLPMFGASPATLEAFGDELKKIEA